MNWMWEMIKWMTTIFKTTMKTETQWTDRGPWAFYFQRRKLIYGNQISLCSGGCECHLFCWDVWCGRWHHMDDRLSTVKPVSEEHRLIYCTECPRCHRCLHLCNTGHSIAVQSLYILMMVWGIVLPPPHRHIDNCVKALVIPNIMLKYYAQAYWVFYWSKSIFIVQFYTHNGRFDFAICQINSGI